MKQKNNLIRSQEGIAHLGLIVLALVVIGAVGFGAWRVASNNKSNDSVQVTEISEEEADAALDQIEDDSSTVSDNTETTTNFTDQSATSEVDGGSNNASF